jgi:hypothetical protein
MDVLLSKKPLTAERPLGKPLAAGHLIDERRTRG